MPGGSDNGVMLHARGVDVEYGSPGGPQVQALAGVDLDVRAGEFVAIVGPSGCGKTTFLYCVDGLVPISRGEIAIKGQADGETGSGRAVVFQDPSLLPWRNVLRNVAYGLELRKRDKRQARAVAEGFIELVGLRGHEHQYPRQLSGGMKQRVNLARALATDPEILLLDEPFAALDAQTREYMQSELLRIWSQAQKTALFITHQIDEAIYLADRVIVFSRRPGRVRADVRIELPRPRGLELKHDERFQAYEQHIWELIKEEGELARAEAAHEDQGAADGSRTGRFTRNTEASPERRAEA